MKQILDMQKLLSDGHSSKMRSLLQHLRRRSWPMLSFLAQDRADLSEAVKSYIDSEDEVTHGCWHERG